VNTPHPDSSFFQEGLIAFEAGNWLEVISSMEGHLSGQPASADAEYYIGEALMNLNIYVNARDAFSRAIAIDQSFAAAYLGRAQASIAENLTDSSAITDLNTALLLDSDFTNAYIARSSYYLDKADTERALEDLAQAEGLNPLSPQVHALKAVIYTSLENYDFALSSAQRAFILDVTLFPNYLILANAYLELERPNDALELMQTYLSFKADNGEAWQILGIAFVQLNEAQLALESFDRALELDSVLAKASYYRGLAYFQDGVANAAIPKYRIAIQGEPDWFEPRIALAEALLLSGDPGAAFFEVNSSGALAITDQQLINFYYWRATILESLGQESNALADWQKILSYPEELVPEDWLQSAIERTQSP
jgi:tetratricopeptide (TPR) repeat protein